MCIVTDNLAAQIVQTEWDNVFDETVLLETVVAVSQF